MIKVIPAILEKDFSQVQQKIQKVENLSDWVQIDISDGQFFPFKSWANPDDLQKLKTSLKIELHMLVRRPDKVIPAWLKKPVKRVVFYYESFYRTRKRVRSFAINNLINKVAGYRLPEVDARRQVAGDKEVGMAIGPATRVGVLLPFLEKLDTAMIWGTDSADASRKFQKKAIKKIKELRKIWPYGRIEADGGINLANAREIVKAGADILCLGSYIFKSPSPQRAIKHLKSQVQSL